MINKLKLGLILAAMTFSVSGCVLPPAISVASLALDVGSFAVSGKTMTDHGISLVAQEDCALTRVLEGEICEGYLEYDVAGDVLTPLPAEDFGLYAEYEEPVFVESDEGLQNDSDQLAFAPPVQLAQIEVAYHFEGEEPVLAEDTQLAETESREPAAVQIVQLKTR